MTYLRFFSCTVLLMGCADSSTPDAGAGGRGGEGGDGGSAGTDPNAADHEQLLVCGAALGCSESLLTDPLCDGVSVRDGFCASGGAQYADGETFAMRGAACLLVALRDRVPGLYQLTLDHTFANGSEGAVHTFAITPEGTVARATVEYGRVEDPEWSERETLVPTQVCQPKSAAFYDDCAAAAARGEQDGLQASSSAWNCVFPAYDEPNPPWFEGCVDASPMCD